MAKTFPTAPVDVGRLRAGVELKYRDVATDPSKGFQFHVGRPLARMLAGRVALRANHLRTREMRKRSPPTHRC